MSSVRGGSFRGRARGSSPLTPSRGSGNASTRGRSSNLSSPRGRATSRGGSGQSSRHNGGQMLQPSSAAHRDGSRHSASASTTFGGAMTGGSWQERYQALLRAREQERTNAIRQGLIADPDKPRALSEAITPTGTCQGMCAEYERVQRVVQKDVWDEELDPNHSAFSLKDKELDETRMVKKFRRAAAGLEEQLPSDLRPPAVLKKTCDYLFNEVVGNAPSLAHVHHFVWDRTRAIRNDFSIQQVTRPDEVRIAIDCYERIARFHIMSLHQLALPEKPYSKYDWQQEREQLDRTLLSLMQLYDDSRGRIDLPHEAEFRAYCVIFQLQDPTPDLEDRVQTWPSSIVRDQRVQKAVELYMAACNVLDLQGPLKPRAAHLIARQDWQRFWTLLASKEVSYLMACVAEIYFNLVRRTVLNSLFRTFRANTSIETVDWTLDMLCELLAFDDDEEVYAFCEKFGFSFKEREDGETHLDLNSVRGRTLPEPSSGLSAQGKTRLVEDKRYGRTLSAVINGLSVGQAEERGLISEEEDDQGMDDVVEQNADDAAFANGTVGKAETSVDDGESLFMPEEPAKQPQAAANGSSRIETSDLNGSNDQSFAFGRLSNNEQAQSIFTQPLNKEVPRSAAPGPSTTAPKFNFLQAAPDAGATTPKPPQFNFLANNQHQKSKDPQSSESISRQQPADQQNAFASTTPQAPDRQSLFAFNPPQAPAIPELTTQQSLFAPPTISSSPQEQRPPPSQLPAPQVLFNQTPAVPVSPSQQPETNVSQLHYTTQSTSPPSTSNHHVSSPGLGLTANRPSFSTDTRPKKPSPLSHSFTAGDESGTAAIGTDVPSHSRRNTQFPSNYTERQLQASNKQRPSTNGDVLETERALEDFDTTLTRIANEIVFEPDTGYLQQYIDFAVRQTIVEVQEKIVTEQLEKTAKDWRRHLLQTKYLTRWKQLTWQRRLLRSGRDRRDRRRRRQDQRASQETDAYSLYDSQAVFTRQMGGSAYSLPAQPESNNVPRQSIEIRANSHTMVGSKRPVSSHGADDASVMGERGHKRFKSTSHVDVRGRITKPTVTSHPNADILKRSSFLDFSVAPEAAQNNRSTTKSNYFRHKAIGLKRAAELSASTGKKRRLESLQKSPHTSPPAPWTSGGYSNTDRSANAVLMPPPSSTPSQSAKPNQDDEALFTRLRAARESLKQSTSYYKDEVRKDEDARSTISSQSSNESPSMAKARAEARLRASNAQSEAGLGSSTRDVPSYRLRESKFVPRENYGRAIERAKEIRESRSRETSRPESTLDQREETHVAQSPPRPPTSIEQGDRHGMQEHDNVTATFTLKPNGFAAYKHSSMQDSAFLSPSKPSAFGVQPPVSFSDHTTQMLSQNPFLQTSTPDSFDQLATHPPNGFKPVQSFIPSNKDHTIDPSQINNSLANSFGNSHSNDQSQFGFNQPPGLMPPQQDSYLPSQSISLTSDDEDEETARLGHPEISQSATDAEDASKRPLDETTEDDGDAQDSYMHTNPYASLADLAETESAQYSDDEGSESEQQSDDEDETELEQDRHYPEIREDVNDRNGYADDATEDEDAINGDIDDNDSLTNEDESQGYDEEDEGFNGEGCSYEEEDQDGYSNGMSQQWPDQNYQNPWHTAPEKNAALQSVGNTAEEAIELSD